MKGKTHIIAKFLWTDLVICSHSREGETPSYSQTNMVYFYNESKFNWSISYKVILKIKCTPLFFLSLSK